MTMMFLLPDINKIAGELTKGVVTDSLFEIDLSSSDPRKASRISWLLKKMHGQKKSTFISAFHLSFEMNLHLF